MGPAAQNARLQDHIRAGEDPMDALWMITVFEIADSVMAQVGHRSHVLAGVPDAEGITVAVVAAT